MPQNSRSPRQGSPGLKSGKELPSYNVQIIETYAILSLMILTAKIKLITDKPQGDALKRTLETTNKACDFLSRMAWDQKVFARFKLQKIAYAACRQQFPAVTSQIVIRALAKVADAYKLDKKTMRTFKPHGAISYDSRILSWNLASQTVSIWTVDGRLKISFAAGKRQLELLGFDRGEWLQQSRLTRDKKATRE